MMANLSEDIQCAGFDTRPPMLDKSDFKSWKQRIRFYCLRKYNGENILKSIDEGPFKMGKFRETLAEGALHLGPERDKVFADLTPEENKRFKADIRAMNILLQGLPKDIYTLINHYTYAKDIWDNVKMLLEGSELTKDERESQLYNELNTSVIAKEKPFMNNMSGGRFVTAVKLNKGLKTSNYDQLYAYLKQHEAHDNENKMMLERYKQHAIDPLVFVSNVSPQKYPTQSSAIPKSAYVPPENEVVLDEEQLLFIVGGQTNTFDDDVDEAPVQDLALNKDNFFQADQCDAFDSDVDEAPTAQTMFMANLSSVDPIYDDTSLSYDTDIMSVVQDHDNYLDSVGEYHKYVKDNAVQVIHSNVSPVPSDALMMIINDMHEQAA
uniref:Integrase, catalytic region, zinc finger, CCHC-type, peptidase aspartic, catalytic n=1 Tax=Tanacetum cinerariifolium TaxID=118510 RepID=A0A6L2LM15_TANCI|nr:hypothetical protein [Tanacetum cinerariifolium]